MISTSAPQKTGTAVAATLAETRLVASGAMTSTSALQTMEVAAAATDASTASDPSLVKISMSALPTMEAVSRVRRVATLLVVANAWLHRLAVSFCVFGSEESF